jgi:hypothetical protein
MKGKFMLNLPNNISKRERIVRGVIGGILIVGALVGLGKVFAILVGLILIAEAALNYCVVIDLIARFKLDGNSTTTTTTFPPDNKPPL